MKNNCYCSVLSRFPQEAVNDLTLFIENTEFRLAQDLGIVLRKKGVIDFPVKEMADHTRRLEMRTEIFAINGENAKFIREAAKEAMLTLDKSQKPLHAKLSRIIDLFKVD